MLEMFLNPRPFEIWFLTQEGARTFLYTSLFGFWPQSGNTSFSQSGWNPTSSVFTMQFSLRWGLLELSSKAGSSFFLPVIWDVAFTNPHHSGPSEAAGVWALLASCFADRFSKLMSCAWRPPSDCSPREHITHLGVCAVIRIRFVLIVLNYQGVQFSLVPFHRHGLDH